MRLRHIILLAFIGGLFLLVKPQETQAAGYWATWFQSPSGNYGWTTWGRNKLVAHNGYLGSPSFNNPYRPPQGWSDYQWWTPGFNDSAWSNQVLVDWWSPWPNYGYNPIPEIGPFALKADSGSRDGSVALHRAWFYLSVPSDKYVSQFQWQSFADNNSEIIINGTYAGLMNGSNNVYYFPTSVLNENGWNLIAVANYNDNQYGGWPNCCNPMGYQYRANLYMEQRADMQITKTDSPDPVAVGNDINYTLTVRNNGPVATANVVVEDTIPGGLTYKSLSSGVFSCSYNSSNRKITCTRGSFSSGEQRTIGITVNVPPSFTLASVSNTATVSTTTPETTYSNNSSTASTSIRPQADMQITKLGSPNPVTVGDNLNYTLSVRNNGPSTATSVLVEDTLPSGVTFVSASGSGFSCSYNSSNRKLSCTRSSLGSGATVNISLVVNVPSSYTPNFITNTATVNNSVDDPDLSNNSSTVTINVRKIADLAISKSDMPDPVLAGNNLQYTLTARNNGPSQAQNVSVTDVLPAGLVYNNVFAPSGWSCSYNASSRAITCSASAMTAGATANITLVVGVPAGYAPNSISNTANVTSATPDPNLADNSATETTAVIKQADLSLDKSDNPDPVSVGENLRYTLSVDNAGPSDAVNVRVVDTLPAGLTFVNVTPPTGWSCSYDATTRSVACTTPSLAAGAAATILLDTAVPSGYAGVETISNTAAVTSDIPDPDPANNSDTEETTINMAWGLTPPTGYLFAHVKVSGEMQPGEQDQNDYLSDMFIPYHLQVPVAVGLGFHKETSPILCTTTVEPCPAENTIQGTVMVESFSISAIESLQTGDIWVFDGSAVTLNRYAEPSLSNCTLGRCIAYGSFTSPRYGWLDPAEYIYLYWQHPSGQPLDCQEGYQCWNIPQVEPGYYAVRGNVTIVVDFPGYPQVQRTYTLPGTANFEIVASFAQPALP